MFFFVDLGLIGIDTFAILGGICVALKKLYDNRTGNGQPGQELEEIEHKRSNIPQQQGELQQQQLNDVIQQVIRALPIQQQLQPQQGGQQHNINVRGPIGQTYDSNRLRGVAADYVINQTGESSLSKVVLSKAVSSKADLNQSSLKQKQSHPKQSCLKLS